MASAKINVFRDGKSLIMIDVPDGGLYVGGAREAEMNLPGLNAELLCRITAMKDHLEVLAISECPFEEGSTIALGPGDSLRLGPYDIKPVFLETRKKDPTRELQLQADSGTLIVRSLSLVVTLPDGGPEKLIELQEGRTVVGKDSSCDIVLGDAYVSGQHLSIQALQGRVTVQDLHSRNGVYLEDEKIQTAEIKDGQTVRIGRTRMTLRAHTTQEILQPPAEPIPGLIGDSECIRKVAAICRRVADTDVTVLIEGETGTGKEVAARGLHQISGRAAGPFIAVNCPAIPKELFESELFGHMRGSFSGASRDRKGLFALAAGGTILLDEIGDLPPDVQVRLLRVLDDHRIRPVGSEQEIHCDVRVLAATNKDLNALTREGKFREDLLYRLRMIDVRLPPLRERDGDIELLAVHFLGKEAAALGRKNPGFSSEALRQLRAHEWPGNVRELMSSVVRALLMNPQDQPIRSIEFAKSEAPGAPPDTLEALEKSAIRRALAEEKTRERAARRLGIAVSTLYEKIRKYELG